MRSNNQRKFFILIISSHCHFSQQTTSAYPAQLLSIPFIRGCSLPVSLQCNLCTAIIIFSKLAWILPLPFKQLIFKPSKRPGSCPSKINCCQSFLLPSLIQSAAGLKRNRSLEFSSL